ncbi:hypothetical protein FEM48_Zijuj12G0112000 [Ziziphus jujuba var. spinosa]|uniref:Nuclease associated modular domain-containing protein n=1 Tax=Ziziphus jujuba var. spinosa TaxID=714518 RepID=A0A978UCZ4_ZIZJJ|nr:hypothetical protein FEM48_Zijuj12G0112000 [Ziziphus jujuba var. spinosa]
MPNFHLRLSSQQHPLSRIPNILVWPLFGYVVQCTHFPLNKIKWNYNLSVLRNWSPPPAFAGSVPGLNSLGALHFSIDMGVSDIGMCCQSIISTDSCEKQIFRKQVQEINFSDFSKTLSKDDKERQRREKIGLANKGRLPWNKGRKHSAETRERIKQRTIEALQNPKVRKKMSERPRSHSGQVKAKIGTALRRIWGKRLKCKQLKEKIFLSWAESIAEAAKTGGSEQEMLDWDSYETLKQDLVQQQLWLATEKAKAKEMAKLIKAEKQAQARAEKAEKLAHKRKKDAEKAKENRKSNGNKEELKLKQRLTKIRRKISTNVQFSSPGTVISYIPSGDKLDLELIKRERLRREVSLADQIRAAKNRKAEFAAMEAPTPSSYAHQFSDTPRE